MPEGEASRIRERSKVFVTGPPSSGKTTIIARIVRLAESRGMAVRGFFTPELRRHGVRVGFDIQVINGQRVPLARKGREEWPIRFGGYRINPSASVVFKQVLARELGNCELLVLDEIGPMELFVDGARDFFVKALQDERQRVIGVVHRKLRVYDERLSSIISRHKVYNTSKESPDEIFEILRVWLERVA